MGYAEVRGKYARPPPLMQKTTQNSMFLAPKENSLISRPSTSGSLQPRSASYRGKALPDIKSNEAEVPINRPIKYKYRCVSNNPENKSKNALPAKAKLEKQTPKYEESIDGNSENKEIPEADAEENIEESPIENEDDFLRDGLSYVSGLTTTSQRKYITELETLLRQEKLRRIHLEESLQKVMEANK